MRGKVFELERRPHLLMESLGSVEELLAEFLLLLERFHCLMIPPELSVASQSSQFL
jgi:hypothetical protein